MKLVTLYDFNSAAFVSRPIKYMVDDDKLNLILKKNDLYDKNEPPIEVEVLYKREIFISNKSLSVENGWECRSEFFMERADITYIWAKAEDEIYRAYKVNSSHIKRWCKYLNQYYKAINLYGNAVLVSVGNHINSLVYHVDRRFASAEEARADYLLYSGDASLKEFLEDIVGEAG